MGISVSHPLVQHSYQLAAALAARGELDRFYTSVFFNKPTRRILGLAKPDVIRRRWHPGIPDERVSAFLMPELTWRLGLHLRIPKRGARAALLHFHDKFDRAVARQMARLGQAAVVVGYETSALHTFRVQRDRGLRTVLDAASVHYDMQVIGERASAAIRTAEIEKKSAEIELADTILTLSTLARDSYLKAGVPHDRLAVVPLGVDPNIFDYVERRPPRRPFTFLYVGSGGFIKGIDLLLRAFNALPRGLATLRIVGADANALREFGPSHDVVVVPRMAKERLISEYANAHVLVLPSRFDGFGQVVLEAMRTGLPAIVSTNVGAKDLIKSGHSGWIFEAGDIEALVSSMLDAMQSDTLGVGRAAYQAVQHMTWEWYGCNVVQVLLSPAMDAR
jgi:glycosyltransferase involved in cell wall biosynthesis